jgi:hypothetical protein
MCTFCQTSDLQSHEKGGNNGKKQFISLFLKPNKENEQYRLRLLFYRNEAKNDRKDPYIVQKVHDHWGVSPKGVKVVDDLVVCPGTKYVHYDAEKFITNQRTGKKELNCPICARSRENMAAYMNSGKTDKISCKKSYQLKAKERLCAPVYVVSDPNNPKNNGNPKVLILTNPDDIKLFEKTVDDEKTKVYLASKTGTPYEIFNGGNAVDLYIRFGSVPEVRNPGKPNETVVNVRKITQITFGHKAYPIAAINKEALDGFEFDDQFYFSNTYAELEDFYKKYYGQNDVSPDEEDVFGSSSESVANADESASTETHSDATPNNVENPLSMEEENVDNDGLNGIAEETPTPVAEPTPDPSSTGTGEELSPELDDIFKEMGM